MSERELVEQLARYLQLKHPTIIYRFDLAADMKLTVGQAIRHKRLHPLRGFPDFFLAMPNTQAAGLFLEIKVAGTVIYKKDGTLRAGTHLAEQAGMLALIRANGYTAEFACGIDECIAIIEDYLQR